MIMRGLKPRSADTIADWSVAIAQSPVALGVKTEIAAVAAASLPVAGGTMTGPLVLAANAASALNPTSFQQTNSLIANAVANLVAGAPVGLDTLGEIAASFNNDPAAFSTLQTVVSGKAGVASPTFTGIVTVPSNTTQGSATVTLSNVQALIAAATGGGSGETLTPVSNTRLVKALVSGNSYSLDLAVTGISAGTYIKHTVDIYGRVISGAPLVEADLPTLAIAAYGSHSAASYQVGTIINQLASEVAALQGATGIGNGHEDTFTGNGSIVSYIWVNVIGSRFNTAAKRFIVFIDGLRQSASAYTLSAAGITFSTAPALNAEIEVLQLD
jgi:hypothetical protein